MNMIQSQSLDHIRGLEPHILQWGRNTPLGNSSTRETRDQYFLESLNDELEALSPKERLVRVFECFPSDIFATVSGGVQSRVIPTLLQQLADDELSLSPSIESAPLVFLDTGDHFPETIDYVRSMKEDFGLDIRRVQHALSPGEFKIYQDALVGLGKTEEEAFDWLTKVEPLRTLIEGERLKVWIAGNRRDQASSRSDLPFAERENGVIKIYPLADLTREDVRHLSEELAVPPHPLSGSYASIGNQRDTKPWEEGMGQEKDGRHNGERTECGLHTMWANRLLEKGVPIKELGL